MRGNVIISLIIATCGFAALTSALPFADPICPNDPSGNVTFLPNPKNCSEYIACDNGVPTIMECPDDLQWNVDLNVCDHPENVNCKNGDRTKVKVAPVKLYLRADPICPNDPSGNVTFLPNPKNCSEYIACDNGVPTIMECPDDLQWNVDLNVCDHPENVNCKNGDRTKVKVAPAKLYLHADPICPNDPSGNVTFLPNPKNCSEYIACDNGVPTIMECPDDLQWNVDLNVCDHPENVNCKNGDRTKVKVAPVKLYLRADPICPNDPSGNVTFLPNPKNCSEYIACDNGVPTIMECPDDLQWNVDLNVCDHPENVNCVSENSDTKSIFNVHSVQKRHVTKSYKHSKGWKHGKKHRRHHYN